MNEHDVIPLWNHKIDTQYEDGRLFVRCEHSDGVVDGKRRFTVESTINLQAELGERWQPVAGEPYVFETWANVNLDESKVHDGSLLEAWMTLDQLKTAFPQDPESPSVLELAIEDVPDRSWNRPIPVIFEHVDGIVNGMARFTTKPPHGVVLGERWQPVLGMPGIFETWATCASIPGSVRLESLHQNDVCETWVTLVELEGMFPGSIPPVAR